MYMRTHHFISQCAEGARLKSLGEQVSVIIDSRYEGHVELKLLDHVSHVKVSSRNVLDSPVVLRIIRDVSRSFIVGVEIRRARIGSAQAAYESPKIDDVLRGLG